ncbi:MAG: sulfotransferase [Sinobacteraceae bacterium]|nr:sulfotransferase [Nevskiaceae bacterium]
MLFSALERLQRPIARSQRDRAALAGSLVVLGYWRSGTTLLHEYLSLDRRYAFPRTYACMHPHHFVLTQAGALKRSGPVQQRPMDELQVSAESPQEDEFALLGLGARSPYEALLSPAHLPEALLLSDPDDLSPTERQQWLEIFSAFVADVSSVEGGRPLVLKSPPHGYRMRILRQLLPDVRFVIIVRSPGLVFESAVLMWRSLFELYALTAIPPEEDTRRAVLQDRPRFEAKLTQGLAGIPSNRVAFVRYEELVRDPLQVIRGLYERLELDDFASLERAIGAEHAKRARYVARNAQPPAPWAEAVRSAWAPIFRHYGYEPDC